MNNQDQKHTFLNANPSPTLNDLLAKCQVKKKGVSEVLDRLKTAIPDSDNSARQLQRIDKLEKEISNINFFEAECTLKALKKYPIFK